MLSEREAGTEEVNPRHVLEEGEGRLRRLSGAKIVRAEGSNHLGNLLSGHDTYVGDS